MPLDNRRRSKLNDEHKPKPNAALSVHIGVDAAMSGVSRFLEQGRPWRYSKKEKMAEGDYRRFTYLLAGPGSEVSGFDVVHTEHGFNRVLPRPPFFEYVPRVRILQRQPEVTGGGSAAKARRDDFDDL